MTDFTASHTTCSFRFTGRERREVIVKQETLLALSQNLIENLLIELGAESDCSKSLSLATGEHCRSVRTRNIVGFNPDGADVGGLTSVKTHTLVKDATTHGFTLNIVVVALHERSLFITLLFGK